jgi:hypothetical protein
MLKLLRVIFMLICNFTENRAETLAHRRTFLANRLQFQ